MAEKTKNKWVQRAIKNPGALRRQAKAEGALDGDGNIKVSWLKQKSRLGGKVGQRARLALTMRSWK